MQELDRILVIQCNRAGDLLFNKSLIQNYAIHTIERLERFWQCTVWHTVQDSQQGLGETEEVRETVETKVDEVAS